MKTSITFYPNTSKKSKKTAKVPLYVRVCLKGKKAEERLSLELSQNELLKWDPMSMRFSDRNIGANKLLNNLDQKFQEFVFIQTPSLSKYNARQILDFVLGKEAKPQKEVKLIDYVDDYLKKAVLSNSAITSGTVRNYRKAINHLKSFLEVKKKQNLSVSDLNNSLAIEFKEYLQSSNPENDRKGMAEVSASSIVKNLKPIFNRAIDEGYLKENPLKILKLRHKSPRRERLTIGHVEALYKLDLSHHNSLGVYRDIFLFSVFTGLAYQDTIALKYSQLEERKHGDVKLSIKRGKTDIQTESFLVQQAIEIINRYKSDPGNEIAGTVLPKRSNEKLNANLKLLAVMANISFGLSSHIARHTYRQLVAEAGIEDMGVIKRMMGHSGSGDIDSVYYSVTESRLLDAKRKFERYLNEHLTT